MVVIIHCRKTHFWGILFFQFPLAQNDLPANCTIYLVTPLWLPTCILAWWRLYAPFKYISYCFTTVIYWNDIGLKWNSLYSEVLISLNIKSEMTIELCHAVKTATDTNLRVAYEHLWTTCTSVNSAQPKGMLEGEAYLS